MFDSCVRVCDVDLCMMFEMCMMCMMLEMCLMCLMYHRVIPLIPLMCQDMYDL